YLRLIDFKTEIRDEPFDQASPAGGPENVFKPDRNGDRRNGPAKLVSLFLFADQGGERSHRSGPYRGRQPRDGTGVDRVAAQRAAKRRNGGRLRPVEGQPGASRSARRERVWPRAARISIHGRTAGAKGH